MIIFFKALLLIICHFVVIKHLCSDENSRHIQHKYKVKKYKINEQTGIAMTEYKYNVYKISLVSKKYMHYLVVIKKNSVEYIMHSRKHGGFRFEAFDKDNKFKYINTDLTGNGQPNLVIYEYGIKPTILMTHIFETGDTFKKLYSIEGDFINPIFKDLNNDKIPEIIFTDCTFHKWRYPGPDCYYPKVIFTYKDGRYIYANELMEKPLPSDDEFEDKVKKVKKISKWRYHTADIVIPPPEILGYMLELIYSGNSKKAWEFYEKVWKGNLYKQKEKYLLDFIKKLSSSRYWDLIKELNRDDKKLVEFESDNRITE